MKAKILLPLVILLNLGNWSITFAQDLQLVGIVDNNTLVQVDYQNPDLTVITPINPPLGGLLFNFAYSQNDCVFYGIINSTQQPTLVSVDLDGNYEVIGTLNIPGGTVYLCEALAYNIVDGQLYCGVSINGGIAQNDYNSETIAAVNPQNAQITVVTELNPGATIQRDIDDMAFIGNDLYIHDGDPGNVISGFYRLSFDNLQPNSDTEEILTTTYYPNQDLAGYGSQLYTTLTNFDLLQIDLTSNTLTNLGKTHTSADFNAQPVRGIDFLTPQEYNFSLNDTTICSETSITLSIDLPNTSDVIWNDGAFGLEPEITVDTPGNFYASFFQETCFYVSDTISVDTVTCDSCEVILIENMALTQLPEDVTLCDTETFSLSIDPGPGAEVVWFGEDLIEFGDTLVITETGFYHAVIAFGDCDLFTDSIYVDFVFCDPCEMLEMEIENDLNIALDSSLCEGDSFNFLLDLPPTFEILWNDGTVGNQITLQEPGEYFATVQADSCTFSSNFINIAEKDCRPCQFYIPNAFSPNGDGINDEFEIFFDPSSCGRVTLQLQIFDRWGGLMLDTNQNVWDGRVETELIGQGAYVYLLNFGSEKDGNITSYQESGEVILLR